jgi:putative DNA primase/helicase
MSNPIVAPAAGELPEEPLSVDVPLTEARTATPPAIRALRLDEFLKLNVKPRVQLLAPILPEKGLAMLYAPRGMDKTFLGLAIAYTVASAGLLMRWKAPAARKVLYIDGEMPLATLQERLANITTGATDIEQLAGRNLLILAADYFDEGLPNLTTITGQRTIEALLDGVSLIVIDNVSTLASAGHDNDVESWGPMQGWLLKLRRRGHSVLLIHHAGKGGQQRGTSRREDVLDTVIALRRPADYLPTHGARFNVHIEKARGALGDDVKAFEAKLEVVDGGAVWTHRDLVDADLDRVIELAELGMSVRDIADETGLSKSTVHRLKKKAEAMGQSFPRSDRDRG